MLVQDREVPSEAFDQAFDLLGKLLGVEGKTIVKVMGNRNYQTIFVSKGYGKGQRRLDIPDVDLRRTQKKLLKSCLYHIGPWSFADWILLTGFRVGKSTYDNIEPHLNSRAFFQLDFADAFPSVTSEMLRDALEILFEASTVKRMFRFKSVRWFRAAFLPKGGNKQAPICENVWPLDVLWALREIIIWLTTLDGKLPQGAPTSPHLFNMVVETQGIPTLIGQCLAPFENKNPFVVTIYADNITISTGDDDISEKARQNVIDEINKGTLFRIKSEKTRYWSASRGLKPITGLSIGTKNGKTFVTVPQVLQRRTRGLLHVAMFRKEIRNQALGMVAYLTDVYGGNLPQQIKKPHEQLLVAISRE